MFNVPELRWLHYSTAVAAQVLTRDGHSSAALAVAMLERINTVIAVSRERNESDCAAPELDRDEIVGTAEAAQIMGCSQRRVQQRIAAGDLDAEQIGRTYYLNRREVEQWERSNNRPPTNSGGRHLSKACRR